MADDPAERVDPVERAGLESFPASDPPAWTRAPPDRVRSEEERAGRTTRPSALPPSHQD